ncbi:CBS domain-containing protein [Endozoicomonas gorgoniicola]|uniref:CBS domain-containing protein n=1 Tax=Endozoicomonas gorgoniicola TaxID=1234144 RepID=A0ABT3MPR7_9GAMM|nr:CBS domain-containing protein [Endozoicomonas gorgoniicola]MCW7551365.1 CBS domain-containing protein [Endozoicomonas gorgoniicola]
MNQDYSLQSVTAAQIMTHKVISVPYDWTVDRLARFFTDKGISGAPVVDESRRLVGVVTLSDIVRQAGSGLVDMKCRDEDFYSSMLDAELSEEDMQSFHESIDQSVLVNDIMTPMVFEVEPDTPLVKVAEAMVRGRIHRVLVTEGRKLKGIISVLDILKVMTD